MRYAVLHERSNPSTAYFVEPYLRRQGEAAEYWTLGEPPPAPGRLAGRDLIVVRYLSPAWRRAIEAAAGDIAHLIYFMDDDLWDPSAWRRLPLRYRWKLLSRAWRHRDWWRRIGAEVWVSSPVLAGKYAARGLPLGVPDVDCGTPAAPAAAEPVVFYHGTASHRDEAEWLLPVVRGVLARRRGARFEIVAAGATARRWGRIPGVDVVPPMAWPDYVRFCRARPRAVGLAPVLDGAFNRARSPVKYFDIARCGAVGVYSAGPVFGRVVADGTDGVLLPDSPERWIDAVVALLDDPPRRRAMHEAAVRRIAAWAEDGA